MFRPGIATIISCFCVSLALAQGTPADRPAPAAPPAVSAESIDPELKTHLEGWEKVMRGADTFSAKGTLERKKLIVKNAPAKVSDFFIICKKPNLARMRLEVQPEKGKKADPNDFSAYICNGTSVFEYLGADKTRTEYRLGNNRNLLLDMMSGAISAKDALSRFTIREHPAKKTDPDYLFIELLPKLPDDRAEFDTMLLVLYRPVTDPKRLQQFPALRELAYMPRTVVIRKNNNADEEIWDFPKAQTNVELKKEHFQAEAPPSDWKIIPPKDRAPASPTNRNNRIPVPGSQE